MRGTLQIAIGALAGIALTLTACQEPEKTRPRPRVKKAVVTKSKEPILPLPPVPDLEPGLVALGEKLFHDPILSADGSVSCASCHELSAGGDDGRQRSLGIKKRMGSVNSPTVLNASLNIAQFWDGRAETLEEQVGGPLEHPAELGSDWKTVLAKIGRSPLAADFRAVFDDGVTEKNVRSAIAAYERTLLTHGAKFDRWLEGDEKALTEDEVRGYQLFKDAGCIACHQGSNVGGNMFQRFGVMGNYLKDRGNLKEADYGRFNVTKLESDRYVFKVPGLRNVEHTAPYFHDGSAKTLPDAVRVMGRYQLGRKLTDEEVELLVGFLKTLSGKLPAPRKAG